MFCVWGGNGSGEVTASARFVLRSDEVIATDHSAMRFLDRVLKVEVRPSRRIPFLVASPLDKAHSARRPLEMSVRRLAPIIW